MKRARRKITIQEGFHHTLRVGVTTPRHSKQMKCVALVKEVSNGIHSSLGIFMIFLRLYPLVTIQCSRIIMETYVCFTTRTGNLYARTTMMKHLRRLKCVALVEVVR